MKPYTFHPEADVEFAEAIKYYLAIHPDLGRRLFGEIERLIGEIRIHPDRFLARYPPARRGLTRKFPYSVIYLDQPDRVWIVAIMHAKRKPGYWLDRIGKEF